MTLMREFGGMANCRFLAALGMTLMGEFGGTGELQVPRCARNDTLTAAPSLRFGMTL